MYFIFQTIVLASAGHPLLVDDAVCVVLSVGIKALVDVWRLRIRWWVELETTALTNAGHPLLVDNAVGAMLSVGIKALVDVWGLCIRGGQVLLSMSKTRPLNCSQPSNAHDECVIIHKKRIQAINAHRRPVGNLQSVTQTHQF